MAINLKVINTKDFIKTSITGTLDLATSKQALLDILSHIKQPGECDVLVDTREAESLLTISDLYDLGKVLTGHHILVRSRICLLVPAKDIKEAGFFETVSVNRFVPTKAFTDFEQAITWLLMRNES